MTTASAKRTATDSAALQAALDALAVERAARARAESALFMRDHVLSILSHDLRGPLNAIHSWAHVVEYRAGSADASVLRAIEGIRIGVEQQVALIEKFVDTVRAATRHLPLDMRATPLAALLDSVLDNARRTLGGGSPIRTIAPDGTGDAVARLDAERVWQALWTALAYAHRASTPGAPIDVAASIVDGAWRVSIAYAPAPATHAAPPSAAGHAAGGIPPLRGSNGLDLALTLPARVADAHDGTFTVEPVAGAGIRMSFSLPLAVPGAG